MTVDGPLRSAANAPPDTSRGALRLARVAAVFLCLLLPLLLVRCNTAVESESPARLPTRILSTPTPTPFSIPARAYYDQGIALQKAGDREKALESFTWAIQLSPDYAPAYVARGVAYMADGQLVQALREADNALEVAPRNSVAYVLRGEVLRRQGRARAAWVAFTMAVDINSALAEDTFRSRWLVATAIGDSDSDRLMRLAGEYGNAHPGDSLAAYYQGWAWLEAEAPGVAIRTLVEGIQASPDPSALLWFALGMAYTENESWQNAIISFENARSRVEQGDASLLLHTDQPVETLFGALGRAYFEAGRCVDAEAMLNYAIAIGDSASRYDALLRDARLCQTPTPTATPYATTTPTLP